MTASDSRRSRSGSDEPPVDHSNGWGQFAFLAAVITLAAALRFAAIGDKSLWFDEAFSVHVANRPIAQVLAFVRHGETHPPLYYLLLSVWVGIFGTSETALRSLGALASTLTVGGTWWLGRRLGGPMVGAIAAFLTAVAPFQVLAAQEARMYPLLGLLTLISWAALIVALEGRRWGWVAYVVATVLALYTHYFAFLSLVGQAVFVSFAVPRSRPQWLVSQLVVVLLYLPWLTTFIDTFLSGKGWPFYRPAVGWETLTGLLGLLSFGGHAFGFDGYFGGATASLTKQLAVLVPFVALVLVGVASHRTTPRPLWVLSGYLVVPVAVAFAFSLRHNVFYARYFSFVFPAFAVLLALGMASVSKRLAPASQRVAALGLVLAFLVLSARVLDDVYTSPKLSWFNWRGAAAVLSAGAEPHDLLVLIPAFGYIPFSYYFKGPQRVEFMTPRELYDVTGLQWANDPAADARNRELFRSYASRHDVMWIIATHPFPRPAMRRLTHVLAGIYDLRGMADFNGVIVLKTVRHPNRKAAP